MGVPVSRNIIGLFFFFVFVGICWVRKLAVFAKTHVFADIMIVLMITVVSIYGFVKTSERGYNKFDMVKPFEPKFSDSLGFAIFAYEGIGLILPVQDITANK